MLTELDSIWQNGSLHNLQH